jgi:hypothetical protein
MKPNTPDTSVIGPVGEKGADMVPLPSLPSLEQVREYIRASKAENTLRGYQSDWRDFAPGVRGTVCAPCPPVLKRWRPTSPNVRHG